MPELPEVETIKNELLPHVVWRTIKSVTLYWERMLRQPSPAEFYSGISERKITGLSRRGKYLVFKLDGGGCLIAHLKMSGSLLIGRDSPPEYTRAIIHLDDGSNIFFRDPRKFGNLQLVKDSVTVLCKLGIEPLSPDFTPEILYDSFNKRKAPVKAVLLDQSLIAGIGNMYADEALFTAGIHPSRPANNLSRTEVKRLHSALRDVLQKAIGNKGASVNTYFRPGGEQGTAHSHFRVAHRGGKPCPACGTPIQRIPIRHRGSYFCPKCQA
ncbi:MAG TPA: bifunctional DNA-formamidopyrimidine glycosylase/DNA-(apurinic or apyrimidinic site) lyase [Dehalococcoidia bacterium]|nr:bifunctional DNA-formamidopyrimidine glycosylase/DNA-(apurinic or apyrimidinic site) lyase [Dehalococcoidia bacterium]